MATHTADDGLTGGLAAIEWGFHVTLVIGAFILATFVWRVLRRSEDTAALQTA